jgi:hypothetical protein
MRVVKCSEPERFQPAGYWASQGLVTEDQVRWELLWQAATSETDIAKQIKEHAEGCDYCGDVLDRYLRLVYAMKPGKAVVMAMCPSAADLVRFHHQDMPADRKNRVAEHVQECRQCASELKWLANSEKKSTTAVIMTPRAKMITILAVAAALIIVAVSVITVKNRTEFTPIQDSVYSTKYRDLARLPPLDRQELIKAAPPSHWSELDKAMSALELGDSRRAVGLCARLITKQDEAAAQYILGRALYREQMASAAKEALLKAEEMEPMSSYRCYSALQIALILGDKPVVLRECDHLATDPQYKDDVAKILDEVKKRG